MWIYYELTNILYKLNKTLHQVEFYAFYHRVFPPVALKYDYNRHKDTQKTQPIPNCLAH